MRSHHIVAIAVVLVIGVGIKVFFFGPRAEASLDTPTSASMNVLQMHNDAPKNLPTQKMHDRTFIFSEDN
jgi:hypothetical protein